MAKKESKPKTITSKAAKAEPKAPVKGMLKVEFLKSFGSWKKGETANYHESTVRTLIADKTVKVLKD